MKKIFIAILFIFMFTPGVYGRERFFRIQSIDTMKYSRDTAREKLNSQSFDAEIEAEIKNISATKATHVSISTPYDEEFIPFMKRWVSIARSHNLRVWFRGNFSGWEKWFDYPKIDRQTHLDKTRNFILNHPDLFEDEDVFTACPECENGGPGDPRQTGDVAGFRKFMIDEYKMTKDAFNQIHKDVYSNFNSMNGDVARLVMDSQTVDAIGGTITIDHYIKSPDQYTWDIQRLTSGNNGRIILGEFGAPIPDLHGDMSQEDQAQWIDSALKNFVKNPQIVAVNYWTAKGSSTALWDNNNNPRKAVTVLTEYFNPVNVIGKVKDKYGNFLDGVAIKGRERETITKNGRYVLPILGNESLYFHKQGYISVNINVDDKNIKDIQRDVILYPQNQSVLTDILERFVSWLKSIFIH